MFGRSLSETLLRSFCAALFVAAASAAPPSPLPGQAPGTGTGAPGQAFPNKGCANLGNCNTYYSTSCSPALDPNGFANPCSYCFRTQNPAVYDCSGTGSLNCQSIPDAFVTCGEYWVGTCLTNGTCNATQVTEMYCSRTDCYAYD